MRWSHAQLGRRDLGLGGFCQGRCVYSTDDLRDSLPQHVLPFSFLVTVFSSSVVAWPVVLL